MLKNYILGKLRKLNSELRQDIVSEVREEFRSELTGNFSSEMRGHIDNAMNFSISQAKAVAWEAILEGKAERAALESEKRYVEISLALNYDVREMLSLLSPEDGVDSTYIRLGRPYDGGYVMEEGSLTGSVAYSFGIFDDISWDWEMAERGFTVFQYDHTIEKLPQDHERFLFQKRGICGTGCDDAPLASMETFLRENGHENLRDIILKIDVEGAEWDVFASMADTTLGRFSQIVIEFHNLCKVDDMGLSHKRIKALANLRKMFAPVHVHGNNCSSLRVIGNVAVPDVLEVTYVRRDLVKTAPCTRLFPTPLDQPNDPASADFWLGTFNFSVPDKKLGV